MRILRRQQSLCQVLRGRSALNIRSGTLLCVFLISMLSLLSALTWPLTQKVRVPEKIEAPIRGPFISITNTEEQPDFINLTRYEPLNGGKRKHTRAVAARVIYITRKNGDQLYFQENSVSAISNTKTKAKASVKNTGNGQINIGKAVSNLDRKLSDNGSEKSIKTVNSSSIKPGKKSPDEPVIRGNLLPSKTIRNSNLASSYPVPRTNNSLPQLDLSKKTESFKSLSQSKLASGAKKEIIEKPAKRTIRYFAKPPWMSDRDIQVMRLLTEGHVERRIGLSQNRSTEFLLFIENTTQVLIHFDNNSTVVAQRIRLFLDAIAVSCKETNRVLAFHLDRIIGLNRIVPTATRFFANVTYGGNSSKSVDTLMWFPADLPEKQVEDDSLGATRYIKKKYWRFSDRQKWALNDTCATSDEATRGRLAVFAFLLQIPTKNLQECFKYPANHTHAPKHLDMLGHVTCRNTFWGSDMRLTGQTWCLPPSAIDLRQNEKLDFSMVESITNFPEELTEMIRSTQLRQKLLQSLFIDQLYWEERGGRKAIDRILQLIDKRAKFLIKWLIGKGVLDRRRNEHV